MPGPVLAQGHGDGGEVLTGCGRDRRSVATAVPRQALF